MKSVRIDFVPDWRVRLILPSAAVIALAILTVAGLNWWKTAEQVRDLKAQTAAIQSQIEAAKKQSVPPENLRAQHAARIAAWLQQDLNPIFATIENSKLPGARLRSLAFDAPSDSIRLEYDLDSAEKATALTALFNQGYEKGPWQLDEVSLATGSATSSSVYRGLWSARLKNLR